MRIALAIIMLSILACDRDSPTRGGNRLALETVARESVSGFSIPERRAVRDSSDWAEVWRTLHTGRTPVPALPAVDFSRETVLLVAAGTRSNGCYAIAVTDARLSRNGDIAVQVRETVPGTACGCLQVQTRPVHVVKLDSTSSRMTFSESRPQPSC